MSKNQTLIDDVMALGGSLMGNILGARHEFKDQAKHGLDSLMRRMDMVTREEFDAAFAMLSKIRLTQEDLNTRLAAIESHLKLSKTKSPIKKTSANLPSVKKIKRKARAK